MNSSNFNNLLTEYQNTYNEYINYLKTKSSDLKILSNNSYIGTDTLNNLSVNSVDDCKTNCNSNKLCTGATYHTDTNMCIISGGIGSILKTPNSTALIPGNTYYNYKLQELNKKLIDLNKQMLKISKHDMDLFKLTSNKSADKEHELQTNYLSLVEERNQINKMMNDFNTLDSAYNNGTLLLNSNYYGYLGLFILFIFLIIVFIKYMFINQQRGGSNNLTNFNINNVLNRLDKFFK
jgi:hypothetical protein